MPRDYANVTVRMNVAASAAFTALLAGATVPQAAERAGIAASTLRDYMGSEWGAALLREMEEETFERARRAIGSAALTAVQTLAQAMVEASSPWATRVQAAKAVLDLTVGRRIALPEGSEPVDTGAAVALEERLLEIRDRLDGAIEAEAAETN